MKTILDLSGLRNLEKDLVKLESKSVEWGFLGGQHSEADMSYAELAWLLEDGSKDIPARPVFRDLISKLKASNAGYEYELQDEMQKFLLGNSSSPYGVHKASGEYLVALHRDSMLSWVSDGSTNRNNSKVTISMKGFNMPFVETGELVQNVDYQIT